MNARSKYEKIVNPDRLTVEQVAKLRHVPPGKIRMWCEDGHIPYHVGEDGEYYFILSEVK